MQEVGIFTHGKPVTVPRSEFLLVLARFGDGKPGWFTEFHVFYFFLTWNFGTSNSSFPLSIAKEKLVKICENSKGLLRHILTVLLGGHGLS